MAASARRLVLVIDDDEVDRDRVRRWIGHRYAICQAATARVGLEMVRSMRPSCVLLDYRLGAESGLEILDELVLNGNQVIMLTGEGNQRVAADAIKRGALDYICKDDATKEELEGLVSHAIDLAVANRQLRRTEHELGEVLNAVEYDLRPALEECLGCSAAVSEADSREAARKIGDSLHLRHREMRDYFDRLIDFVRCTEGKVEGQVDLRVVAQDALEECGELSPELRVEFVNLPIVSGSAPSLKRLFCELTRNALRHGGQNMTRVRVSAAPHGIGWEIYFEDNGAGFHEGIPAIMMPRIGDGRGWGLAVAQRIAAFHGGRIKLESAPDVGVRIKIYVDG